MKLLILGTSILATDALGPIVEKDVEFVVPLADGSSQHWQKALGDMQIITFDDAQTPADFVPHAFDLIDGALVKKPPAPISADELQAVTAHFDEAVQRFMDGKARSMGYTNIYTAIGYADEPADPEFQREGRSLRAWRSLCWRKCIQVQGAVLAGARGIPTEEELIAELPEFSLLD